MRKDKSLNLYLHLVDGRTYSGFTRQNLKSFQLKEKLQEGIWGEAVFTTAMSGYQETLTDPSYLGQHLTFSFPHVGNYPASNYAMQSDAVHATSAIAHQFSYSANTFLQELPIPLVEGIDTRSLVRHLTQVNSSLSVLTSMESRPSREEFKKAGKNLRCNNLNEVSTKVVQELMPGANPIVVVDYGIKRNILKKLISFGLPLVVVPWNTSAEKIKKYSPRLVFLSNGPGDPAAYTDCIAEIQKLLKTDIPIRGICLGHQLIALSLGVETLKMPFGHRGINHPVLNHLTQDFVITSQNHGYAVDETSFNKVVGKRPFGRDWIITHTSLFDETIQGLASTDRLVSSVQHHPEASPGPLDAAIFFDEIAEYLQKREKNAVFDPIKVLPSRALNLVPYKRILLIGPGPIRIGQASEFDYSGVQAAKVLKNLGMDVVLLNSNPATIMTDPEMAKRTYVGPMTLDMVKQIIVKENIEAIISTMGGQTSLNICYQLQKSNFLERHGVALLGSNATTIEKAEDRDLFDLEMKKLGYVTAAREVALNESEAVEKAARLGYPIILRRDFALGGLGASFVHSEAELLQQLTQTGKFPLKMEKSLRGYKEVEMEIMIDKEHNGVVVCSIENIDPCGIHTGDSITVAPALTISDHCLQKLRTMSLEIGKAIGVVAGGANVQFAINPRDEDDIYVIEMNPRVSRSSALASKATGYPIAKISALLAVGHTLKDIENDITQKSPVCFEPSLDYVALKIPYFPFNKFPQSSDELGPQMRSVGEVLSIGGNFLEAFFKALRSMEKGFEKPYLFKPSAPLSEVMERLSFKKELSLLTVLEALRRGGEVEKIQALTQIDPWFIQELQDFVESEREIQTRGAFKEGDEHYLRTIKNLGFSDAHLAQLTGMKEAELFQLRLKNDVLAKFRPVDTCSGEFEALTPYYYATFSEENESVSFSENEEESILLVGSGPHRIGQGIEFDYSCVKACQEIQNEKRDPRYRAIIVNCNPETVSTDYDTSDRLYLTPLYGEDVVEILLNERPSGVIASFAGQTGIHLRAVLEGFYQEYLTDIPFLGPTFETIRLSEDRELFAAFLEKCGTKVINHLTVHSKDELITAIEKIGAPVIVRPSFVIGGESMFIFQSIEEAKKISIQNQTLLVEKYLENALEYDVDLVRDQFGHTIMAICEHVEHAGVHSGDSGMITPPIFLSKTVMDELTLTTQLLAEKLEIVGPINFQYALKNGQIYCLEANPRGSRTIPFLSKAYGLPLANFAVKAMMGEAIPTMRLFQHHYFSVKQSTFPFDRFLDESILLGPKMRSTGETMALDLDRDKAILKSHLANYPEMLDGGNILLSLSDDAKPLIMPYLKNLYSMGYRFYATRETREFINRLGIACKEVQKIGLGQGAENILNVIKKEKIKIVFNTPTESGRSITDGELIRQCAIKNNIPCFTRPENIRSVLESIVGTLAKKLEVVCLHDVHQLSYSSNRYGEESYQKDFPVILALDEMNLQEIVEFLSRHAKNFSVVKIGLEAFLKYGPRMLHDIHERFQLKIFLDLKIHDIPNTMKRGIQSLKNNPIDFLSLHLSAGEKAVEECIQAARVYLPGTKLLGITHLTSLNDDDFQMLFGMSPEARKISFENMVSLALKVDLHGIVCSAQDLNAVVKLEKTYDKSLIKVCPGIRFKEEIESGQTQDQKRVLTPEEALELGANYLVMGRSFTRNPLAIESQVKKMKW